MIWKGQRKFPSVTRRKARYMVRRFFAGDMIEAIAYNAGIPAIWVEDLVRLLSVKR
jgi:hypothetical protein